MSREVAPWALRVGFRPYWRAGNGQGKKRKLEWEAKYHLVRIMLSVESWSVMEMETIATERVFCTSKNGRKTKRKQMEKVRRRGKKTCPCL